MPPEIELRLEAKLDTYHDLLRINDSGDGACFYCGASGAPAEVGALQTAGGNCIDICAEAAVSPVYWDTTFSSSQDTAESCSLMIQSAMEEVIVRKPEWLSPIDLVQLADSFTEFDEATQTCRSHASGKDEFSER